MTVLVVFVALFTAAVALIFLLEIIAKRPDLVVGLILGLEILWIAIDPKYVPTLNVGGAAIYLTDILFTIVALAALVRLLGTRRLMGVRLAILVAALLAAFSVYRGINVDGLQQAVNEARPSFYFLAGISYFMTVIGSDAMVDRISRMFLLAAGILSVLVVILWSASLSGGPVPKPLATPAELGGFRVIGAAQAMILTQALLIALPNVRRTSGDHPLGAARYVVFLLLPVCILLQHRTVWVATAVGLLILAFRRNSRARGRALALIGATALVLVVAGLLFNGRGSATLTESLGQSTDTHTLDWRYEGWIDLLDGRDAPRGDEILIGAPYGLGYEREVFGIQEDVSPHNYYLETYLRHGLIGLGALLVAFALTLRALWKEVPRPTSVGLANSDVLLALTATQLVFFFTYAPSMEQCIVSGLAIGAASTATLMRRWSYSSPTASFAGRPHIDPLLLRIARNW